MVETLLLPADRLPSVSPAQIDAAVRGELGLRWINIVRLRWLVREVGGEFEWPDEHVCRVVGVPEPQLEAVAIAMRAIAVGENTSTDLNAGPADA